MRKVSKNRILLCSLLITVIIQITFFIINNIQYKYNIYPRHFLNTCLNINFTILIISSYILIKNLILKKIVKDNAKRITSLIFKVISFTLGIVLVWEFGEYIIFSPKEEILYDGDRKIIKAQTVIFTNTVENYYEPLNMLYEKVYFLDEEDILNQLNAKYNEEFKVISSDEGNEGIIFYNVCSKNNEEIVFKVRNEYNFEDNYKEVYTLYYFNQYLKENNIDREVKLNSSGVINIICTGKNDIENCAKDIDGLINFLQNHDLLKDSSIKLEVICKNTLSGDVLLTIEAGEKEDSIYYYKGEEALKADLIKSYN